MSVQSKRRPRGQENEQLRARLADLEEALRAIRRGEVDALVVSAAGEERVFTLESADHTYRLMVEQMPRGAATLSDDGVVLYCNPFLAGLIRLPVEAVVGARLADYLDEPAAAVLRGLLLGAEHDLCRDEVWLRTGSGSVPTRISVTRLPLPGRHVFCLIVTDLTETKRREKEQAQLQRERVARIAAEEANRLKDEFLSTLSHELRTPLNAIVSWAHVLRQPGLDPGAASRAIEAIHRNCQAQTQLIAGVLDMSQLVTGKLHVVMGPVRMSDVIASAVDVVRPAARSRNVRLELAIDASTSIVSGDAGRLEQVILSLLSNATRFAPEGGRVDVRLEASASSVEVQVMDDGPGIEPAFLPFVFDRFRQADSSSTRSHGGLGLGLAVARHLLELHGGTIEVHNRGDRSGAVFVLRLPRQQACSVDGAEPGDPHVEATVPSPVEKGH